MKEEKTKSFSRLDNKSRMMGDYHVRICERLGLKCPCLLDFIKKKKKMKSNLLSVHVCECYT